MASPERELVGVAMAHLRSTDAVTALVGDQINYRRPEDGGFPCIGGFDTFTIRDDATCLKRRLITLNVQVWTRDGVDPLQDARALAHEVAMALDGQALALPSNRLVTLNHRGDRIFYDVDGLTGHGVVEFRAIVSTPAGTAG